MNLRERVEEAVSAIGAKQQPEFAIILGTGLGGLADRIQEATRIPYDRIPHFARSTVESHKGELILGTLEGRPVVAFPIREYWMDVGQISDYQQAQVDFQEGPTPK